MNSTARLANAITAKTDKLSKRRGVAYGTWIRAEAADPNLSEVHFAGMALGGGTLTARYVPKLAHVTGLTAPSTVLCTTAPLCIIGRVVGKIALAEI